MTLHPIRPPDWAARAACAGLTHPWHDPWFPDTESRAGSNNDLYTEARLVCDTCPVWRDCRDDAMTQESGRSKRNRFGFRGGLTPTQRWLADPARGNDDLEESA